VVAAGFRLSPDLPRYWQRLKRVRHSTAATGSELCRTGSGGSSGSIRASFKGRVCRCGVAVKRPFTGALVPGPFHLRDERVRAVMVEVNRSLCLQGISMGLWAGNSRRGASCLTASGWMQLTRTVTDEGLVKGVLMGDDIAFSLLYKRYWQPICSAAYRIIQNSEDAQDVTQEIAFKPYKSLHQWDDQKAKLSTWIYKMAVNHAIDCHRVHRRRQESQLPENGSDQNSRFDIPDCSARSPFKEIENQEQIDAVLQWAGTLPDLQRQIFFDRYFDECKLEEIAEIERCSRARNQPMNHRSSYR
jgi:RNA polymerase sigma factor (sigma-70 family)